MEIQTKLQHIQSILLDRLSSAVSNRDFAKVAELSGLAKECETFEVELASLHRRVEAAESALNGSWSNSTPSQKLTWPAAPSPLSAKAAAAQARDAWVANLRAQDISLHGHRTRFQTARGRSVAVAFANEGSEVKKNRWFLGLPDERTEVGALLCRSVAGELYDIVLPISDLREVWRALSRSGNQVKFNVKRDASRFLLLVPAKEPLDLTRYVGNYEPLR